ncbi:helix-turn-helix transcriptional regulator [Frankia sp. AgB1.9]|uniref:helix-turn-helix domain-containing protein n=1 Tax=unclassified Frankia TaxID=2632575 RepID=UPI001931A4F4|nr:MULTISPECIES: helix-turn-helix transcriptional regulator [unclassified Frankia]MBL7491294.1 helix-turn-helix transcriptional regulator [Frankia sp. AgW1.1]MBL7551587.1 helix-turn-helix transcriptional regulator [Frankia sp. AgB1.9]MBL7621706.1 helix-turn-helix transcriptional regulator [Frankia sp. AgB1.8]
MSPVAALHVRELGDYIRDQRRAAHISLRQLAQQAGVSNPYLSQIERGLRKPSAEILQQIAKALRISAEVLYVQAGILEEREGGEDVHAAVLADEVLTARQKQVILDIYDAFRRENAAAADLAASAMTAADETVAETPRPAAEPPPAKAEPVPPAPRRRASTAATATGTSRSRTTKAGADDGSGGAEPAGTPRPAARRSRAAASAEPGETASKAPRRAATTRRAAPRRAAATTTARPDSAKPDAGASSDAPAGVPAGSAQPNQASTSEP